MNVLDANELTHQCGFGALQCIELDCGGRKLHEASQAATLVVPADLGFDESFKSDYYWSQLLRSAIDTWLH